MQGFAGDASAPCSAAAVALAISPDPVDAAIFYREVPLPLAAATRDLGAIRWRLGRVASEEAPRVVLGGLPTCANCHSFSADGTTLGMDLDYGNDKGSYLMAEVGEEVVLDTTTRISWNDFRRDQGLRTLGLLSQLSPDGRWAASTVQEVSIQHGLPQLDCPQLFFPVRGIVALFDRRSASFSPLPGADDPDLGQTNPSWSPDGRTLLIARAPAVPLAALGASGRTVPPAMLERFVSGAASFRFDLYSLPFNDGRGGRATPLAGASHNHRSNFFPRYSPDGRWVVFCQAASFMLNQLDSELYIVAAGGGTARRLRCNFPGRMNSWHSWSPNGRWLVFSSKYGGPYTRAWLTHLDADGNDAVPVLLEGFAAADRAVNLPELVAVGPDTLQRMRVAGRLR